MENKYVFINNSNNSVIFSAYLQEGSDPILDALIAAFNSNFKMVETDQDSPVNLGWTYDGEKYISPDGEEYVEATNV